jgi:nitroreductase/NAD-dependent dihydropyrimidine dehydrogenase PreA subunit
LPRLFLNDMTDYPKINRKKCGGCGLCVAVCPSDALFMHDGKASVSSAGCIFCGHCRAVCKDGAVDMGEDSPSFSFSTFQADHRWLPNGAGDLGQLARVMYSRRSCRLYMPENVPWCMLQDLVRLAISAPSGTNSQGWKFIIMENRKQVVALGEGVADFYRKLNRLAANPIVRFYDALFRSSRLSQYYARNYNRVLKSLIAWDERQHDRLFHGAPAVILIACSNDAGCPIEDSLVAAQNILLASHVMGLGSCLIGYAVEAIKRSRKVQKMLQLSAGETVYAAVALGYPAVRYRETVFRKEPDIRTPLKNNR